MPKQRNHPHHHPGEEPREGLRLPRISFSPIPTIPRVEYPDGLESTPPPGFRRHVIVRFLAISAGALLILIILGTLFGGR